MFKFKFLVPLILVPCMLIAQGVLPQLDVGNLRLKTNTLSSKTGSLLLNSSTDIQLRGQMSIGSSLAAPNSKALLDLQSTSLGFLAPRMTTTQVNAITSPTEGLLVYDTILHVYKVYNGTIWQAVGGGIISSANGGTGIDTSSSTGIPRVSSGSWSVSTSPDIGTPTATIISLTAQTSPAPSPAAGSLKVYAKTDNKLYSMTSGGTETAIGSGGGGIYAGGQNLLINNSWEADTSNWGATGGTYTRTTTAGQYIPPGIAAGSWDSNTAGQYFEGNSSGITITSGDGISGQNGVFSCAFKCASGTCTHTMAAFDGSTLSNVTAAQAIVSNTTTWTRNYLNFVIPSSSSGLTTRIYSVASNEPQLFIDDCYLGKAEGFNLGYAPITTAPNTFTPTGSWSTNTTYTGLWAQDHDYMWIHWKVSTSGAPTSAGLTLNIPSGYTINTAKLLSSAGGDNAFGWATATDSGVNSYPVTVALNNSTSIFLSAVNASGTYGTNGQVTQAVPFTFGSGDYVMVTARVPIVEFGQQAQVYLPPQTPYSFTVQTLTSGTTYTTPTNPKPSYIEVYMVGGGGGGAGGGTAAGTAAGDGGDTVFDTNTAGKGTKGSWADTGVGVGGTNTAGGAWTVISNVGGSNGGGVGAAAASGATVAGGVGGTSCLGGAGGPGNWDSTGTSAKTNSGSGGGGGGGGTTSSNYGGAGGGSGGCLAVKINNPASSYSMSIGSGGTFGAAGTGANASTGGSGAGGKITVKEYYGATPMPLLVNSVISDSNGVEKVTRARLLCSSASAVNSSSVSGLTIGNISAGSCTVTFPSGTFSTGPTCVNSQEGAPSAVTFGSQVLVNSATSVTITGLYNIGGTTTTQTAWTSYLLCMGPK